MERSEVQHRWEAVAVGGSGAKEKRDIVDKGLTTVRGLTGVLVHAGL